MKMEIKMNKPMKKGEKFGWGKVLDYIGVEWETEYGVQEKLF